MSDKLPVSNIDNNEISPTGTRIEGECANCNTSLLKETKFCYNCGAKVINYRLTLKHFLDETSSAFFNLDTNKPIKTFVDLCKKPEEVIGGYINGVRKKYINAFGYFTIAITLSGLFNFILTKAYPDLYTNIYENLYDNEAQTAMMELIMTNVLEYQTFIFFLSIPVLALWSKLVFLKNKKFNYTEHLVLNTYAYSQASIFGNILYFSTFWNESLFTYAILFILPIQIIYFAYVLKRMFNLSIWKIILKTLLFVVILLASYIVFTIILVLYMLVFTDALEKAIELEKAKQGVSYINSCVKNWTS